jgi:ketosteroid isomerase-like protein
MRKLSFLAVSAMAAVTAIFVAGQARATNQSQAEIKALQERLMAAIRVKDYDAIMACYIPGEKLFVFDVVPPRQYVGAPAYKDDWKAALGPFKGPVAVTMSDLTIVSNGSDLAYGHSIQDFSGTDSSGAKIAFVLRATDIYRKVNGKWLIEHEHYSVPVDLTTAKADLMSKP